MPARARLARSVSRRPAYDNWLTLMRGEPRAVTAARPSRARHLEAALTHKPDLREAHALLLKHHLKVHEKAETSSDKVLATDAAARISGHIDHLDEPDGVDCDVSHTHGVGHGIDEHGVFRTKRLQNIPRSCVPSRRRASYAFS